jgi:type II secretory ATPase GspE/PulE/Tfp pilus assembly ATPase PilB-like protein
MRVAQVLPLSLHGQLLARLKILSGLRTDEHQAAQDGRFRFTRPSGVFLDIRVSTLPTYHGENAVLRLLAPLTETTSLEALGFEQSSAEHIRSVLGRQSGLILVTGPTGSGKSTTLYSLVQQRLHDPISIVTIEDPIEYSLAGTTQIQTNARTGLTFSSGLRAILRQDPDIIMVGEIRDAETASLAIHAALTGHLVLATLHTTDAPSAFLRLLDLGIEPYLIASTVSLVIAQRLVRKVCDECRVPVTLSEAILSELSITTSAATLENNWARGEGCPSCEHAGYRGRIGVNEVLPMTRALQSLIESGAVWGDLMLYLLESSLVPMRVDAAQKASAGITTLEEVLRLTHE